MNEDNYNKLVKTIKTFYKDIIFSSKRLLELKTINFEEEKERMYNEMREKGRLLIDDIELEQPSIFYPLHYVLVGRFIYVGKTAIKKYPYNIKTDTNVAKIMFPEMIKKHLMK